MNATFAISKQNNSPQIALVLGHNVKHLALLKVSVSIQNGKKEDVNEARYIQEIYQTHWNNKVSSVAKRRQKLRHINQPARMTLSEDLITLKEWFCGEMIEGIQNDQPDKRTWEKTGHITLLRISLLYDVYIKRIA